MDKKEITFDVILSDLLNKFDNPEKAKEAIYRILFLMISRIVEEAIADHVKEKHE